jgi:hypothetical protein
MRRLARDARFTPAGIWCLGKESARWQQVM